jgi:hypothetical protein
LKCMKVKFNISVQCSHHIWTSVIHSGQFQRLKWEQTPTSKITKATWRCS